MLNPAFGHVVVVECVAVLVLSTHGVGMVAGWKSIDWIRIRFWRKENKIK